MVPKVLSGSGSHNAQDSLIYGTFFGLHLQKGHRGFGASFSHLGI